MKEIPILFSTPMVQAIMEDRKTQTRRIVKCPRGAYGFFVAKNKDGEVTGVYAHDEHESTEKANGQQWTIKPKARRGDLLYVRETWAIEHFVDYDSNQEEWFCMYKADYPDGTKDITWRPSIHMGKCDARIWLRVTDVRVERLNDISPGDACDEGIEYDNVDTEALEGGELQADFTNYMWRDDQNYKDYYFPTYASCVDSYKSLWESINGEDSWALNPWVWVYEFEVVSKTGKP